MKNGIYNEATPNRPEGTRLLDAPLVRTSLPKALRQLRSEVAWEKNDRNAITLFHNESLRVVLVALHEGVSQLPQSIDAAVFLQMLEGRIWLETSGQSISLDDGETIALQPGLQHIIYAELESVFLLTLSGDTADNGAGYSE